MNSTPKEIVGLLAAVIMLAAFAVAIKNGSGTASILKAGGDSFSNIINAATHG